MRRFASLLAPSMMRSGATRTGAAVSASASAPLKQSRSAVSASSSFTSNSSLTHPTNTANDMHKRTFADEAPARFVPKPVFSSFKVYKSKSALDVSVSRATLQWNNPDPAMRRYLKLKRAGGLCFTFATGENKSYDWTGSEMITLSVNELGDLLSFFQDKSASEMKVYHDPGLGSQAQGQVRKELVIKRIGAGKPGYFFNFSVTGSDRGGSPSSQQRRMSIAVSEGESQVMQSIIQQAIPAMLALNFKPTIFMEEEAAEKQE